MNRGLKKKMKTQVQESNIFTSDLVTHGSFLKLHHFGRLLVGKILRMLLHALLE